MDQEAIRGAEHAKMKAETQEKLQVFEMHVQTNPRDALRPRTIFQGWFGADHSLDVWLFSTYHVLCDTLFDATMDHA